MSLHVWAKISPSAPNSIAITAYIFLRIDIASPQHLDRSLFTPKIISNRHISCDVDIRSDCGSCPADVATPTRPRTATHDHGRFYSFINKISFHGSRRFIFTGSCSVYIIMRQLSRAKPGNPASRYCNV